MAHQPHPHFLAFVTALRCDPVFASLQLDDNPNLVHIRGAEGQTALHEAVRGNDLAMARLLLARGAAVDARSDHGSTPLMDAAKCGFFGMAELLLDHGADLALREAGGDTALSGATMLDRYDLVGLFLARLGGQDVNDHFDDLNATIAHGCASAPIADLLRLRGLRNPEPNSAEVAMCAVG
jgi:ankyrin repeat protein